jgi:hypothetical protein
VVVANRDVEKKWTKLRPDDNSEATPDP